MSRGERQYHSGNLSNSMRQNYSALGVPEVSLRLYTRAYLYRLFNAYLVLQTSWRYLSQSPPSRHPTMSISLVYKVWSTASHPPRVNIDQFVSSHHLTQLSRWWTMEQTNLVADPTERILIFDMACGSCSIRLWWFSCAKQE